MRGHRAGSHGGAKAAESLKAGAKQRKLLGRLRLGREEFRQRLLTMLILAGPYPKWNSRSRPSPAGVRFLKILDALSFGVPDYAVVSPRS